MAKERDLGQEPQDMHDDRSDRESGQPLQLDDEKANEKHQDGRQPAQGEKQHRDSGGPHKGGQQHQGGNR